MYKKIVFWMKRNNKLPYAIMVAVIYKEKLNPNDFYNENIAVSKERFIEDCSKPNFLSDEKSLLSYCRDVGIPLDDLIESEIWHDILCYDSINEYLNAQEFENIGQIEELCSRIYKEYIEEDTFADRKKMLNIYGNKGVIMAQQFNNVARSVDGRERWLTATSLSLWFGKNAIKQIDNAVRKLMNEKQTTEKYNIAKKDLMQNFNFTELQCEMFKYSICQSLDPEIPASLNKALYIWGDEKGTGKTTIAGTLVCILNGEKSYNSNLRAKYESTFAQEVGIKDFVAPKICSCRAVLLDEAMPKDSSKSYDSLKKRLTSDGATVRFIHKNQQELEAKANYFFTSNAPLSAFVQDEKERRFFEIRIEKKHKKLTYNEIYKLFLNFAKQCKREKDWQEWYDEMEKTTEVFGFAKGENEDIQSVIELPIFYEMLLQSGRYQFMVGDFTRHVREYLGYSVKNSQIKDVCIKMFGEPKYPSRWAKYQVIDVLSEIHANIITEEKEKEEDDKLPF